MKKLIAIFISLLMVLSLVPVSAENIVLSSEFDGKMYVPIEANIPFALATGTALAESDIAITADGAEVTDFTLETEDDLNYTVSFSEEMTPDADYTVSYGGESISFHTSYNVNRSSASNWGVTTALDKPVINFTAKISQKEGDTALEHINGGKAGNWEIHSKFYDADGNFMWIRQMLVPPTAEESIAKINVLAYYFEKSSGSYEIADRLVCTAPIEAHDMWATYKDGMFYIYALDADGDFSVYGTFDMAAALEEKEIDPSFVTTGFCRAGENAAATIYIGDEFISASSTLNAMKAVPVSSKIPVDFTGKIAAEDFSVEVKANDETVESSAYKVEKVTDYRYLISFNENMAVDSEYVITVSSEKMEESAVISYTTSFDNTRFTTVGTGGHTLAVPVNEYSVSLELLEEIPLGNYWGVLFYDTSSVKNAGGSYSKRIWLNVQRPDGLPEGTYRIIFYYYNNDSSIGDRVFAENIPVTMSNLYFTCKDGVYYIYGKEADGTYKHLNTYNAKAAMAEIADFTWDKVAAWNTSQIQISGGDNLGDIISLSSTYDGYTNVPVDSVVPVSFDGEISLTEADFAITADGAEVTDFTVENTDGNNYAITFNSNMAENAKYAISSKAGSFHGEISFTTAFDTAKFSLDTTLSSSPSRVELDRKIRDVSMSFKLDYEKAPDNMDAYIYLSDTDTELNPSGDNKDRLWIRFCRNKDESGNALDKFGILLYRYENNSLEVTDRSLCQGMVLSKENEFVITIKNYIMYLYVKQTDGSYVHKATYNMTNDSASNPIIPATGFEFGAISARNTGLVTINAGYADALTAEATDVNAESGSTITLNFNNEIASAPETVTIDGVTANVAVEGKTATLTLNAGLAYLTDYTVDISGFKDIFGQSSAIVGISTPRMPDMYSISNVKMQINGAEENTLKAGTLTFSIDVKRNLNVAPEKAVVIVALYEKTNGKLYMKECKSVQTNTLTAGAVQSALITPEITVPQASSGTEYSVKVMLWEDVDSAFPLTTAINK